MSLFSMTRISVSEPDSFFSLRLGDFYRPMVGGSRGRHDHGVHITAGEDLGSHLRRIHDRDDLHPGGDRHRRVG